MVVLLVLAYLLVAGFALWLLFRLSRRLRPVPRIALRSLGVAVAFTPTLAGYMVAIPVPAILVVLLVLVKGETLALSMAAGLVPILMVWATMFVAGLVAQWARNRFAPRKPEAREETSPSGDIGLWVMGLVGVTILGIGAFMATVFLRPANFHAQFVDQHGQPIAGVRMRYQEKPFTAKEDKVSDARGRLSVRNVEHAEEFEAPGYEFGIKRGDCLLMPCGPVSAAPEHPYVVHGWKREEPQYLASGQWPYSVELGQTYALDFTLERVPRYSDEEQDPFRTDRCGNEEPIPACKSRVGDIPVVEPLRPPRDTDDVEADVLFRLESIEPREPQPMNLWYRLTLSGRDGGILPMDDQYPNMAPASGYQASLVLEKSWQDVHSTRYYFTSRKGRVHGWLELNFDEAKRDAPHQVRMQYQANPSGSRNLTWRARSPRDPSNLQYPDALSFTSFFSWCAADARRCS
jgi:hypothetical protein